MKKLLAALRALRNERGEVAIVVAASMTVLMMISALAVDIGLVRVKEAAFQSAVDAAVMAAVQKLPNTSAATSEANRIVALNGYQSSDISVAFSNGNNTVRVTGKKNIPYYFGQVIGLKNAGVNKTSVAARERLGDAFNYSLFSGSTTTSLNLNGTSFDITGSVHSNNAFTMYCSTAKITGTCEANKTVTIGGSTINVPNRIPNASIVSMPDFSDIIKAQAKAAGTYYATSKSFNQPSLDISNGIYVEGDLTLNVSQFTGAGCVFATGSITFNLSAFTLANSSSVCFYAKTGNININASSATFYGILYAPNGSVNINASIVTAYGRIIGKNLGVNVSSLKVVSSESDLNSLPTVATRLIE